MMSVSQRIPVGECLDILPDFSILSGKPFLINEHRLILGDIHLGQQSSFFSTSSNSEISQDCIDLTNEIMYAVKRFHIEEVIINGDIKHATYSFVEQEKVELSYLFDHITGNDVQLTCIRGNHDLLLNFITPVQSRLFTLTDYIDGDTSYIFHGHEHPANTEKDIYIISHEHPTYEFRGYNHARVKLPAFVVCHTGQSKIIILPAANKISGGTKFPPRSSRDVLSPILKEYIHQSVMEIYPFDGELGILLLPDFHLDIE